MPIGKVWIYRLLFVFVCLFVCTVTDFSGEDKASGVKFCTAVHRRPEQGISNFGELCSPEAQNRTPAASIADTRQSPSLTASARGTVSACVDIQPSQKTDVLV